LNAVTSRRVSTRWRWSRQPPARSRVPFDHAGVQVNVRRAPYRHRESSERSGSGGCETVLDVRLPKTTRLDRIEVRRIRILPGHAAGLHVHNGSVLGSIVEGSVVYQVEGEQRSVLGPGEVFHEPEGARIARFDAGDEGVTFLAHFLLSAGQ
jgi:quercetin dioxygenase-like cupin family protein